MHVVIAGVVGRGAVRRRAGAARATGCIGSGVARHEHARARDSICRRTHMSAATQHGRNALLLRSGAFAPPGAGRVRPVARSSSARASGSTAHGWGAWVLLAGLLVWAFVMQQWFRQAIGESEGGLYSEPHRRLVPLEHELVHLLGGDVLRRLLRRALLGPRCIALPSLGSLENAVLWPDFKAVWPSAARRRHRRRRPASSSRSRPWARGRSRPSTPRCC